MSDNNEISAVITTEEPEVAATLSDLRYLVFQGKKGDTGDSAYEEAVALGFVGTEAEWLASLKGDPGFSPEIRVTDITGGHRLDIYNELGYETVDVMDGIDGIDGTDGEDGTDGVSPTVTVTDIVGGHRVTITDVDGAHTFDVMDGEDGEGGGTAANAVLYTPQTLTDAQKEQARGNLSLSFLTAGDVDEIWGDAVEGLPVDSGFTLQDAVNALGIDVIPDPQNFEIGTYWGASSYPTYGSTLNKGTDTNTIRTIDPIYIPAGYTINTHGKLNIRLISVLNNQYSQVVNYSASGAVYPVESNGIYHICFQLVKSSGTISSVESALDGVEISTSPSIAEDVAALKADNAALGVDGFLLTKYSAFQLGGLSSGNITTSTTRICTTDVCIADEDLNLHINSGFRIGVHTYKADGTFEKDSGWLVGDSFYQIPQGKKFRVVLTPVTEYTIYNAVEAIPEMVSNVQCNRLIDEMPLMREMVDTMVYPYNTETANHISTKKQPYLVDTVSYDAAMPYDSYSIPQDIAVYDGKLFVAHNKTGGKCITIQNADTGALIATVYSEDLNHANVISFGGSFFDASDPYPLLYVSTESSSQINVFRITNSALTLVKTYAFADVGYYGNHCIDPVNNILYMIGYVQNTYNDGTNNFCIFSAYNLNSEIDNGNDTYSAELMYKRRIPYIMTHQGNTFYNGNIYLLSSDYDQHNTKIYVLDTIGRIVNILEQFPSPIPSRECEGITFSANDDFSYIIMLDGSSKFYQIRFEG